MLYCIMPYYGQPCSRTACVHPSPVTLSYGRSTDKDIHIYIYVYVYTYIYIYIYMDDHIQNLCLGWHYLSHATCLIRPRLLATAFLV